MSKRAYIVPLSVAVAMLLGGCAHNVVPTSDVNVAVKANAVKSPKRFQSSYTGGKVADGWLRSFRDPTLNRLVKEAQRNNPDLKKVVARVEKAAALMNITYSGLMPTLNLKGNYQFRSWEASNRHDKGDISLALSWEPDLWGRVANEVASDSEMTIATIADFEWARQSLSAQTARAWFLLGSDKMLYDFYRQVIAIQKKARDILEKRAKIGQGNMRDVHMIKGMLAEAQDGAQRLKAQKQMHARALETLIGRYPANSIKGKYLKRVRGRVPAGVPADLLNRRADIIAAQYRVASAFHHVKSVELLRLPRIDLEVRAGSDIIQHSMAKFIGGIFMPVFDAGKIQAKIDAATAEQKEAIANYEKVVLNALREVENYLALDKQLARREYYLDTMVKEYKSAYDMTYKNYKIGQGTILDVLSAQSKWINARILRTQVLRDRLINRVNLHLALGGSFDRKRR